MRHLLQLDLAPRSGALLRVLAVVERRGFAIEAVAADGAVDGTVALTVRGDRDAAVLGRQLERLVEVRAVCVTPLPAADSDETPP